MHLLPDLTWTDITSEYTFTLVDEHGEGVDNSIITALTLTYYHLNLDTRVRTPINGRTNQDILNANDVSLVTDPGPPLVTYVSWLLQPEDLIQIQPGEEWEVHEAMFHWTFAQGARQGKHQVAFGMQAG